MAEIIGIGPGPERNVGEQKKLTLTSWFPKYGAHFDFLLSFNCYLRKYSL